MKAIYILLNLFIFSCSINNSRLFPTDDNDQILENVTVIPQQFTLVSGGNSSCYVYENGKTRCWGQQTYEELRRLDIKQLSIGSDFLCAFDFSGSLICLNDSEADLAVNIPSNLLGKIFSNISSGHHHACGIDNDKKVYCWGDNSQNQITIPSAIFGKEFLIVKAGANHTCGISSDTNTYCWGSNDFDQSIIPSTFRGKRFTNLSLGLGHSCGITSEQEIFCWGRINIVDKTANYIAMSSGDDFVCTLNSQKDIRCWFAKDGKVFVPKSETELSRNYNLIAAGAAHLCATTTTKKTFCWGENDQGQLEPGNLP